MIATGVDIGTITSSTTTITIVVMTDTVVIAIGAEGCAGLLRQAALPGRF
jgi:hypothetical protein